LVIKLDGSRCAGVLVGSYLENAEQPQSHCGFAAACAAHDADLGVLFDVKGDFLDDEW
jgi:hypothetical protein